ncbi:MAG: hypothetical protein R3236_02140, partial [Phycisphaeraceae bacterium]|nr:hypothetical protein [Phycisphaeraceae bacterium]
MDEKPMADEVMTTEDRPARWVWLVRGVLAVIVLTVAGGISRYLVATKPEPEASGADEASIRLQVFEA